MIKKIIPELSPYEKYFLATEAPTKKPWKKVVKLHEDERLKDYNDHASELDQSTEEPDESEMDLVDDNDTDYNSEVQEPENASDNAPAETPNPDDNNGTNPEENLNTPMVTTQDPDTVDVNSNGIPDNQEVNQDANNDVVEPDATDTNDDADTGEGELVSDDQDANYDDQVAGDESDTGGEQTDTPQEGDGSEAPANNLENQLKYSLYRSMKSLYLAVMNYESRCGEMSTTSYNYNLALKTAKNKFNEIEDVLFEYMTVKFKDESYIENMKFYQKCLTAIKFIFKLIRENRMKKDDKA
jgi:hypothetical protein